MNRRTAAAVLATSLLSVGLAAPSWAAARVSIGVQPKVTATAFTATGKVVSAGAGRPVTLQRLVGASWRAVRAGKTKPGGGYALTTSPVLGPQRVRVGATVKGKAVHSAAVTVTGTLRLTQARSGTATRSAVAGVLPTALRRPVRLEHKVGSAWKAVSSTSSTSRGGVSATWTTNVAWTVRIFAPAAKVSGKKRAAFASPALTVKPLAPSTFTAPAVADLTPGAQGAAAHPSLSGDGRYVAFSTTADGVVPGDSNASSDVFWIDRQAGTKKLVSHTTAGSAAGNSSWASISRDGRWVAFWSTTTGLFTGTQPTSKAVYLWDSQTGAIVLVTHGFGGVAANGESDYPSVSGHGEYVAFESKASNLVPQWTNGARHVFTWQHSTGAIALVSHTYTDTVVAQPVAADQDSSAPSISADGEQIAYFSDATDLLDPEAADGNGDFDIYLWERTHDRNKRISVLAGDVEVTKPSAFPAISSDGQAVAYYGPSELGVQGPHAAVDILRWTPAAGNARVSLTPGGGNQNDNALFPVISDGGARIAYESEATDLVASDTNGASDVFLWDAATGTSRLVSAGVGGSANGASSSAAISADGRWVAFVSTAVNLGAAGGNGSPHLVVVRIAK
jgi:Tol biopolymer transport system component